MLKCTIIGALGADCKLNTLPSGKQVINFSVASSEKFKNAQGQQQEKTTWIEAAYFTEKTGIAPYLKKGTQVYAEGTPEIRTYQKNDGTTGVSFTLRVSQVQLLGGGKQEQTPAQSVGSVKHQAAQVEEESNDLPF